MLCFFVFAGKHLGRDFFFFFIILFHVHIDCDSIGLGAAGLLETSSLYRYSVIPSIEYLSLSL